MNRSDLIKVVSLSIVVSAFTSLLIGGSFIQNSPNFSASIIAPTVGDVQVPTSSLAAAELDTSQSAVVEAVKKANPAVVAITISKDVPVYERYYENLPGPFGDFFNYVVPQIRQRGTENLEIGGGSGFFVSEDGYIVTNRHVVDDESAEYTVLTNAGETYTATVAARDPALDLAVLKVEGGNFPYLPLGDSDTLEVGQSVIAIGNALSEFQNTVSVGIVSGLSRSIVASDTHGSADALDQLIQTDAAINQGNSGGPLLNLAGEVIGINVAVASGAENIGFALSVNSIKSAVLSVKQTGRIVRPYLGVRYVPITEDLKELFGLQVDYGLFIRSGAGGDLAVVPGSPADKAGIAENDIILKIDGQELTEEVSLGTLIRSKNIGDALELLILSNGKERTVNVTLEEME